MITWINSVLDFLDKAPAYNVICGLASVIGLLITISVSIKTKSINERIKEIAFVNKYNKERKPINDSLKGYQQSFRDKDVDVRIIRVDALNDLNQLSKYSCLFTRKQNKEIRKLIAMLEDENSIRREEACNILSKLISFTSEKKEK